MENEQEDYGFDGLMALFCTLNAEVTALKRALVLTLGEEQGKALMASYFQQYEEYMRQSIKNFERDNLPKVAASLREHLLTATENKKF